ncbi:MAG: YbaB/EbfC family nucleoid-associated protein [Bacteroidota bacterium]
MFGDLMGNMEEQQKALKAKLAQISVEAQAGDGAVKVKANANREIVNISFDKSAMDWEDQEQVEDLVMVAVNRVLQLAAEKEAEETQKMIQDMMPPGLGGLGNLFGG